MGDAVVVMVSEAVEPTELLHEEELSLHVGFGVTQARLERLLGDPSDDIALTTNTFYGNILDLIERLTLGVAADTVI